MVELVGKPRNSTPTAEQLAADRDRSIEMSLLMSGKFDAEIAQLKALRVDVDAKIAIANTLDAAEAVKAKADEYAAGRRAEADADATATQEALQAALAERDAAGQERAEIAAEASRHGAGLIETARAEAAVIVAHATAKNAALVEQIAAKHIELDELAEVVETARQQLEEFEGRLAGKKAEIAAALGLVTP